MNEETFTYAVVDDVTGIVINRADWDGKSAWSPGEDCTVIRVDDPSLGSIGDIYQDGSFISQTASETDS